MSMEPDELARLVGAHPRASSAALGDGAKAPQPSEADTGASRGAAWSPRGRWRPGEALTAESLAIKRPGGGIAAGPLGSLSERRLTRALAADEQLTRGTTSSR